MERRKKEMEIQFISKESRVGNLKEESATPMTASCPYPTAGYDIEQLRRKQRELDALYEKKEEVRKEALQSMEGAIPTAFQNILNWDWSPLRIYNYLQRKTGSITDSMEHETQSQEKEMLESQFKEKERLNKKTRGSITEYELYMMDFGRKEKIEGQFKKEESRVETLKGSRTDYGGYEMEFGKMEKMEDQFKKRESPEGKLKGSRADYGGYEMEFGKMEKMEDQFQKRESRKGKLKDMSLSKYLSPTVVSTSSITVPELDSIHHISFVTSDKLWVSNYKRLLQVDSSGHEIVKKRMETDIRSDTGFHTVTEDGDLLFINRDDRVQKITSDGTIKTLIKSDWRGLICIHSSRINGDILLGYHGGVLRYDRKGQLIEEALEDWVCLIYHPRYITENKNGDIWVSNGCNAVVVADKSGRHRFNYRLQQFQSYFNCGFEPHGVCTDILGHGLVCDVNYHNPSVHLLDQDGQFLCLLLTREHGLHRPMALCVDDKHNLYLGQRHSNTITVYKYLKETGDKNTSSELDVSKTKAVYKYLQQTEKKKTSLMESK